MIVRPVAHRHPSRVRAGFTLVEVIVVVSILVILAGLATFAVVRTLTDAKVSETELKMQKIEQACKTYYAQNVAWPGSLNELISVDAAGRQPLLEGGQNAVTDGWGHQINYQVIPDQNGSERVLLTAQAPNGQPIQWPKAGH